MDWLEQANKRYRELVASENIDRSTYLRIRSENDIPEDLTAFSTIAVDWNFDGQDTVALIEKLIANAPNLITLRIYKSLPWAEICRLDLSRIQSLSVSLSDVMHESVLSAPVLKSLWISQHMNLTPLEKLVTPTPHIDFSNMPLLEDLHLSEVGLFDPNDIKNLQHLKKLYITDGNFTDLRWLSDAHYQLEMLCVWPDLEDCSGIETQSSLIDVNLSYNTISDISPIEQLTKLKSLYLRHCPLSSEGNLRHMGIEKLIITQEDDIQEGIRNQTHFVLDIAVRLFRSEEKRFAKIDELPERERTYVSYRMKMPPRERLKNCVWTAFKNHIANIEDKNNHNHRLTKEEYIRFVTEACYDFFPFLQEMDKTHTWHRPKR